MGLEAKKLKVIAALILSMVFTLMIIHARLYGTRHSFGNILINLNGKNVTLEEAVKGDYLGANSDFPPPGFEVNTTNISFGHNAEEIWVSINGSEMTLADAIETGLLCSLANSTTTSYSYPRPNPGHYATEIEMDMGDGVTFRTLQYAIDIGFFCGNYEGYGWKTGNWSECSVSCGGGIQTRDVWCQKADGQVVSDNYCSGTRPATNQSCNTQMCPTVYNYPQINQRYIGYSFATLSNREVNSCEECNSDEECWTGNSETGEIVSYCQKCDTFVRFGSWVMSIEASKFCESKGKDLINFTFDNADVLGWQYQVVLGWGWGGCDSNTWYNYDCNTSGMCEIMTQITCG